jgi:hypothetical protein
MQAGQRNLSKRTVPDVLLRVPARKVHSAIASLSGVSKGIQQSQAGKVLLSAMLRSISVVEVEGTRHVGGVSMVQREVRQAPATGPLLLSNLLQQGKMSPAFSRRATAREEAAMYLPELRG